MEIKDVIKKAYVKVSMESKNRNDALMELLKTSAAQKHIANQEAVLKDLLDREASFTTKVMAFVAIPHAKSDSIKEPMVLIGKSDAGVDWRENANFDESVPEDRVKLVFMILVPGQSKGNDHLKILAVLARCLASSSFRENLILENSTDRVYEMVINEIAGKLR
ncbi:fructose PTS transporter subunit IIA [Fusibacter paucivorans]|uniref:Fructose PTS transporter subunit IIA n=1 Tax=Fusibacter paucivorans TaxID=76009 RepID=A0ABS5PLI2_9FIRM|nr:fructose PTS transporter subunit IIA [Fusibacter paucivorans]MBS7525926.1 fructose PTS transporter subunit IIA [Fusibacter paucivorans]